MGKLMVLLIPYRVEWVARKGDLLGWYHGSKVSRPQDGEAFLFGGTTSIKVNFFIGNQVRWYRGSPLLSSFIEG